MKHRIKKQLALFLVALVLLFTTGCKKEEGVPIVETSSIEYITQHTAKSGGNITSRGGSMITIRGVCWSTDPEPTIDDDKSFNGFKVGEFNSKISGLLPNTTYYMRAYATNSYGTGYGNTVSFTTHPDTFTDNRDGRVYRIVTIGN